MGKGSWLSGWIEKERQLGMPPRIIGGRFFEDLNPGIFGYRMRGRGRKYGKCGRGVGGTALRMIKRAGRTIRDAHLLSRGLAAIAKGARKIGLGRRRKRGRGRKGMRSLRGGCGCPRRP